MTNSMLDHALGLAENGWAVLPLGRSKLPRIGKSPECKAAGCTGGCGREGHGVKDATTDPAVITRWFTTYPDALIGARVPDTILALDIDPRHQGDVRLAALEREHSPLPETLTVWSGRGDGGRHLYYLRPSGKLTETGMHAEIRRLGHLEVDENEAGIDLKAAGYCVVPPSRHPATGLPYRWEVREPVELPNWMVTLLRPAPTVSRPVVRAVRPGGRGPFSSASSSIADEFTASRTWAEVLEPHGWRCLDADGDRDGARWRHPAATSAVSATVRHGCLFVYSSNTPFEVTSDGTKRGYTRFRAYAVLEHQGNLSAAAKHVLAVAR